MVLFDGKKISQKILDELKQEVDQLPQRLRLAVIWVGKSPVIKKFIEQKKKAGESMGVDVRIYHFEDRITTNELRKSLAEVVHEKRNTGVIVQLPLPPHINSQYILNSITSEKDVDVLSARAMGSFVVGKSPIMPPVAGAVRVIFDEYGIFYKSKNIAILGGGNLVGKPVALWLLNEKVTFSVVRSSTENPLDFIKRAEILVTGIGRPRWITGDMVKDGVVVVDAGTSESEGKLVGDVDFESVAPHASYITPVPGGVGPVTVAVLLKNLVSLAKLKRG